MSDRKSQSTGTAVFGEYMLVLGMVFLTVFVSLINEDGAKLLDLALSCVKADGEYAGAVATAYSGRTGLKNITVTGRTHENAELLTALKNRHAQVRIRAEKQERHTANQHQLLTNQGKTGEYILPPVRPDTPQA